MTVQDAQSVSEITLEQIVTGWREANKGIADDWREEIITAWRKANKDAAANHDYNGPMQASSEGDQPVCVVCGDNPAGLLHAFDPAFCGVDEGYFDSAIFEVVTVIKRQSVHRVVR